MVEELKGKLLEIELSLKKEDWEKALHLYEEIEKNWEKYSKGLDLDEARTCLDLVIFIDSLLKEKVNSLKEEKGYLSVRKSYSKFL